MVLKGFYIFQVMIAKLKIYCLTFFLPAQTCKFCLIGTFHFTGRSFPSKESLKKILNALIILHQELF